MNKPKIYIGFFTYARYDHLIIDSTEAKVWTAMRKKYYEWKRQNEQERRTFAEAKDYFGWNVDQATYGSIIEY